MRVLLSEAAQNEFLPVSGLTLADALDAVLRTDGSEFVDLPGGAAQLVVFAKRMRREGAMGQAAGQAAGEAAGEAAGQGAVAFTVLAGGQAERDDVNLEYVLKLLPDVT